MLFAAGFGTRMGALTAHRPKPLIEVSGRALIDHALDHVNEYGPTRSVANLHYLPDQIEAHLSGKDVVFSRESPDILETGGGLRAALPLLGEEPVFTMNTDAVWQGPNPLTFLAKHWNEDQMDALLLCIPKHRASGHSGQGDFIVDDNNRAVRGPGLVYSGLQIIKTNLLHDIPQHKFSLNILWDMILSDGQLKVANYPGRWCDVGKPESIALAEDLLKQANV